MSLSDAPLPYPAFRLPAATQALLPVAVFAAAAVVTRNPVPAIACAAFAALMQRDLRGAGFTAPIRSGVIACLFLQSGLCAALLGQGDVLRLAIALYLVVSRAVAFAALRSLYRMIALGLALALAQILHPLSGVAGALSLPLLAVALQPEDKRHRAGFAALLMFIPLVSALVLAWLYGVAGVTLWPHVPNTAIALLPSLPLPRQVVVLFCCAPVLWLGVAVRALRNRAQHVALGIAFLTVLVICVAAWRGAPQALSTTMAAVAALSAGAIAAWPHPSRNGSLALAASALTTILSWLLPYLAAAVLA
ncbi:MAG: hypothetical protein J0H30_05675 [Alphaproteobacteria bacterium]|nr:hypothetical protein [Alphaproteobacteria bacterium]